MAVDKWKRKLKSKYIHIRVTEELKNKVIDNAEELGIDQTLFVEIAIENEVERIEKEK
jgi:antitoxin component of RelBE/YafQ-DinJ toxin-antitoxin module